MRTSFITMKGIFVLSLLLFFGSIATAQTNPKAKLFQKKGQIFYKLFQKAEQENNYPYTDKDMVENLQKAEVYFHRAKVLYKTDFEQNQEEIKRINLYLKIIAYHIGQIKERRKEYTTSR